MVPKNCACAKKLPTASTAKRAKNEGNSQGLGVGQPNGTPRSSKGQTKVKQRPKSK